LNSYKSYSDLTPKSQDFTFEVFSNVLIFKSARRVTGPIKKLLEQILSIDFLAAHRTTYQETSYEKYLDLGTKFTQRYGYHGKFFENLKIVSSDQIFLNFLEKLLDSSTGDR
jgi:hypothetical protein